MSHLPKNILLATDGSGDARMAAWAAANLSEKAGAELHIIHVWQSVPHPVIDPGNYEEEARRTLEEETRLVSDAGGVVGEAHLMMGTPVDAILDLGEELGADLIVVGSRGHGALGRLVLGSVSEGVVHHSTRPVLVLRGGEDAWPPERVIIGDDASKAARKAGELASSIGALYGAKVILARAYPELPESDHVGRVLDPRTVDDALRRAERDLHKRAEELGGLAGSRPRRSGRGTPKGGPRKGRGPHPYRHGKPGTGLRQAPAAGQRLDQGLESCRRTGARLPARRQLRCESAGDAASAFWYTG
jgi:nucleotide-binding universal stress UspA family protein